jgi:hypothetical protein
LWGGVLQGTVRHSVSGKVAATHMFVGFGARCIIILCQFSRSTFSANDNGTVFCSLGKDTSAGAAVARLNKNATDRLAMNIPPNALATHPHIGLKDFTALPSTADHHYLIATLIICGRS